MKQPEKFALSQQSTNLNSLNWIFSRFRKAYVQWLKEMILLDIQTNNLI